MSAHSSYGEQITSLKYLLRSDSDLEVGIIVLGNFWEPLLYLKRAALHCMTANVLTRFTKRSSDFHISHGTQVTSKLLFKIYNEVTIANLFSKLFIFTIKKNFQGVVGVCPNKTI